MWQGVSFQGHVRASSKRLWSGEGELVPSLQEGLYNQAGISGQSQG